MSPMLELKYIRSNFDKIKEVIKNRGYDLDVSVFESIDRKRRDILPVLEGLRHDRNRVSQEIAEMKKNGEDASHVIEEMKKVSSEIKSKESELSRIEEDLNPFLMIIPNVPDESVPVGVDEKDNPAVRTWGEIRKMDFEPLPHWDIGERSGILDFSMSSKIISSRV